MKTLKEVSKFTLKYVTDFQDQPRTSAKVVNNETVVHKQCSILYTEHEQVQEFQIHFCFVASPKSG